MVRTQIQLTEVQARALKEEAAQDGVSIAEVVRQAVDRHLEERRRADRWRKALAVMGRYSSGLTDISVHHDKYLEEGYLS